MSPKVIRAKRRVAIFKGREKWSKLVIRVTGLLISNLDPAVIAQARKVE
jgi:hypothetical protein